MIFECSLQSKRKDRTKSLKCSRKILTTSSMVKISNNTLLLIGVLVAAVGIWYFFIREQPQKETMELPETKREAVMQKHAEPASRPGTLVLFYGNHCPHCHHMMPAWEEAKKALLGKLQVKELESGDPEVEMYVKPAGVPNVRFYPNGVEEREHYIEYKGDRSAGSLETFALSGGRQV